VVLDTVCHDVRYALRGIRRAPGSSTIVVATLALAIGANTALFSLLNAIVLRHLPVSEPDRLAVVSVLDPATTEPLLIYYPTFVEFAARQRVFESVALHVGGGVLRVEARGAAVDGGVEAATANYYDLLGVRPQLGRFISSADAPATGPAAPVVVISFRFWQRQFGGDPHAIGETLTVDGVPLSIVGITPPSFHGLYVDGGADFCLPLTVLQRIAGDPTRPVRARTIIGRLRRGVTLDRARAEIETSWPSLVAATLPASLTAVERNALTAGRVQVQSLATGFSTLRRQFGLPLFVLVALTALLLMVGCANMSSLALARLIAREQQLAIQMALGATEGRLVRQAALENVALALLGTMAAVPLAFWTSRAIGAVLWGQASIPLAITMTPDVRVLTVAATVGLACGLLVGIVPAWVAARRRRTLSVQHSHVIGVPAASGGRVLLLAEVAGSLVLLAAAGLFVRTLMNLRGNESALPAQTVVWARLWLTTAGRNAPVDRSYYGDLAQRLSAMPGAESVAFSMYFPAYFNTARPLDTIALDGAPPGTNAVTGLTEVVSPRFFETVGIARLQGRDFTWRDDGHATPVAIVSASLARKLFGAGPAIGRRIRVGRDPAAALVEIVGVVADAAVGHIRDPRLPMLYRPMLQEPERARVPVASVRGHGNITTIGAEFARVVASSGRHFLRSTQTLEQQIDDALLQERLAAWLSSCFAGLALLLASIGIYGLLAYAAARRTREIGVRMALGASRTSVLRLILGEGARVGCAGVALGVPCALAVAPLARSLVYGVGPNDPVTLAVSAAMMLIVAIGAGLLPAIRAATVDPMTALREE
jgi:predicted permease